MNIKIAWHGITVTKRAQKYFYNLLKNKKYIIGIKIDIKKSGCAGFKYNLSLIKQSHIQKTTNYYIYTKNKINIYIPIKNMLFMDKTEIDFVTIDGINMNIKFKNPNVNMYCGCGDSFHITNIDKI